MAQVRRRRSLVTAVKIGLFAACLWLVPATDAAACSCLPVSVDQVRTADAVLLVTVKATANETSFLSPIPLVRVSVGDVVAFRGRAVWTLFTVGGTCTYGFEPGRRYLVTARRARTGSLITSVCDFVLPAEHATDVVSYLTSPSAPARARVLGRVSASRYDAAGRRERNPPIAGALVSLVGDRSWQVTTGADGLFAFLDVPPGRYRLRTLTPEGRRELLAPDEDTWVDVGDDPQDVRYVWLHVDYAGEVRGELRDTTGHPVSRGVVSLSGADGTFVGHGPVTTDADGSFRFTRVSPGRFVVHGPWGTAGPRASSPPFVMPTGGVVTLEPLVMK